MRKLVMTAIAAAALSWAHAAQAEDAQQAMERNTQKAGEQMQGAEKAAGEKMLFEGKDNFDVKGKISKASRDSITITRDKLPPATLKLSKETKIEVDGNASSVDQLRPGQDVRASFNLEGAKPLAVEIKAKKAGK